ncbi:MAG TPA: hypothetical protein GXX14_06480 [Clostridiaceae bacterium]|nr:hypothetical protein [Clostridiaceae bacterium]
MGKKGNVVVGTVFIIIGGAVLMENMGILNKLFGIRSLWQLIGRGWPSLFLILPGIIFHCAFFSGRNRNPGLLVPGGILLVLGIVFQINMLFGGWHILWPGYILAVAVGLFELYYFGTRDRGLLIPVGILAGLSFVFFTRFTLSELFNFDMSSFLVPLIFVIIGLSILFGGRSNKKV